MDTTQTTTKCKWCGSPVRAAGSRGSFGSIAKASEFCRIRCQKLAARAAKAK
jgi:hypothetical protein